MASRVTAMIRKECSQLFRDGGHGIGVALFGISVWRFARLVR